MTISGLSDDLDDSQYFLKAERPLGAYAENGVGMGWVELGLSGCVSVYLLRIPRQFVRVCSRKLWGGPSRNMTVVVCTVARVCKTELPIVATAQSGPGYVRSSQVIRQQNIENPALHRNE